MDLMMLKDVPDVIALVQIVRHVEDAILDPIFHRIVVTNGKEVQDVGLAYVDNHLPLQGLLDLPNRVVAVRHGIQALVHDHPRQLKQTVALQFVDNQLLKRS